MKNGLNKGLAASLLGAALFLFVLTGCASPGVGSEGDASIVVEGPDYSGLLNISEIMVKNHATITDENGEFCDWVELKNISGSQLDLTGWALSDKAGEARFVLGSAALAPDELLLVYLGGDETLPYHADFSISGGETLYLYAPDGTEAAVVNCPDGEADCAYAPLEDGSPSPLRFATPGYPNNNEGYDDFCASSLCTSPLVINEVMVSNLSYKSPNPCVTCDWVEVKNVSSEDILLSDYYLSDDDDDYLLWQFPAVTLAAGECMAVYCSGDPVASFGQNHHTNFSLNASDEELYLSKGDELVDYVHLQLIPPDYSMGRLPGQNGFFYFSEPTLNGENNSGLRRISQAPTSPSVDGVFNDGDTHTVEFSGKGDIYYTLDGSLPSAASTPYTAPISVDKTTIVRAVAVEDGAYPSSALTLSYILNENHTLSVLSLVVDNQYRFDAMFSNGVRDIFLQANLALYDENGGFNSPCGVTMKGWTSLTMNKKSLGVYFKGKYGADDINYDIFGNGITQYSSLSIRAGQDYNRAIFRNELFQDLCVEISDSVMTQQSKYTILYVNGRYWGIYSLKEDFSRQYYASNAGVSKESVEVQKAQARHSSEFFKDLVEYSWHADPTTDEYYQTMSRRLDVDSLIDWFILQGYSANVDIRGNVRYFRSSENGNKWQFGFYDLDWAFYYPNSCYTNVFEELGNAGKEMPTLVKTMMRNPTFRERFLIRFSDVISTSLSNEHVLEKIDHYQALLEPEAARDRERWGVAMSDWYYYVDTLRDFVTLNDLENKTVNTICSYLYVTEEEAEQYFGR